MSRDFFLLLCVCACVRVCPRTPLPEPFLLCRSPPLESPSSPALPFLTGVWYGGSAAPDGKGSPPNTKPCIQGCSIVCYARPPTNAKPAPSLPGCFSLSLSPFPCLPPLPLAVLHWHSSSPSQPHQPHQVFIQKKHTLLGVGPRLRSHWEEEEGEGATDREGGGWEVGGRELEIQKGFAQTDIRRE